MIVSTRDEVLVSEVMRDFKRHTSTKLAETLEANNEKIFLYHFKKAAEKQESNIKNPVRKGYVLKP